jgi:hypothetical protein
MSKERELLRSVLDAIKDGCFPHDELLDEIDAVLAKPEAEPLAYVKCVASSDDAWYEVCDQIEIGAFPVYDSPRPYEKLPSHKKFDAFIRAFWRRINAYKNDFDKELPEEMPVQFRASMETALLVFDDDESGFRKGRSMQRLTDREIEQATYTIHPEDYINQNSSDRYSGIWKYDNAVARAIETAIIVKNNG